MDHRWEGEPPITSHYLPSVRISVGGELVVEIEGGVRIDSFSEVKNLGCNNMSMMEGG